MNRNLWATAFLIILFSSQFIHAEDRMKPDHRSLVGRGRSYEAIATDTEALETSMAGRRSHAWKVYSQVTQTIQIPNTGAETPLFETWYDEEEFGVLFAKLFLELSVEERQARKAFDPTRIEALMQEMGGQRFDERWGRRITTRENQLKKQKSFHQLPVAYAGITFTLFSPEFIIHFLNNYKKVEECTRQYINQFSPSYITTDPENFSLCFEREFPANAVMLKTVWAKPSPHLQVFHSDADKLTETIKSNPEAMAGPGWVASGETDATQLTDKQIFTVQSTEGESFQLLAMHIVTKEVRKWVWATFWWTDEATQDLGADRPKLKQHFPGFANYQMCTAVDFKERDIDTGRNFDKKKPSLAASLRGVQSEMGTDTWCANPYLENNFPKTNCIGCHQNAPLSMLFETKQMRENFPDDFPFSFDFYRSKILQGIESGETAIQTSTTPSDEIIGARVQMNASMNFAPKRIEIKAGETIEFTNNSRSVHTVTGDPGKADDPDSVLLPPGAEAFDSGRMNPGDVYKYKFTVPGLYRYFCIPHEHMGMNGEVIVK